MLLRLRLVVLSMAFCSRCKHLNNEDIDKMKYEILNYAKIYAIEDNLARKLRTIRIKILKFTEKVYILLN